MRSAKNISGEGIGSLVAEARSCLTNHQWDVADAVGNRDARDTFEAMQGKAMPGN